MRSIVGTLAFAFHDDLLPDIADAGVWILISRNFGIKQAFMPIEKGSCRSLFFALFSRRQREYGRADTANAPLVSRHRFRRPRLPPAPTFA